MVSIQDAGQGLTPDAGHIRQFLTALVPGVYEVRIPEPRRPRFYGTQHMYLSLPDDFDVGIRLIASVTGNDAAAVYVVGNPVDPALLGRGRAGFYKARSTASDEDIVGRRLLYVDIDAVRPSAINATPEEIEAATTRTAAAVAWLRDEFAFPTPLFHGTSGSGGMLLYRIDLPNDAATTNQIARCLAALDDALSDDRAKVDAGVYNAARIFRVPGTVNAKSATPQPDRPWSLVAGTWANEAAPHD